MSGVSGDVGNFFKNLISRQIGINGEFGKICGVGRFSLEFSLFERRNGI